MNLWNRIRWIFDNRWPAYIWENGGRFYAECHWDGKFGLTEKVDIPYPQNVTLGRTVEYLEEMGCKVERKEPVKRKKTGLYQ